MRLTALSLVLAASAAAAKPLYSPWPADLDVLEARQAGLVPPNSTISVDPAFPTDVGYPGKIRVGQAPFLAQNDDINSTQPRPSTPYENRYTPAQSSNDSFDILKWLGNTSPYFNSPLFPDAQKNRQISPQCKIRQVHYLHRHGSRYPTSYSTEGAPFVGALIANITANTTGPKLVTTGPLAFLANWTYGLGAEVLTPSGAQELFDSGIRAYYQYGHLYNATTQAHKPVIRTTSQQRMLDSARFWTTGFFGLDAPNLINLEVIIEDDGFNNTLAPYDTCEGSNNITVGDTYLTPVWEKTYLNETVSRLQSYVTSGLNITTEIAYGFQSLCAYETVGLGYSNFCNLFTEEEWRGFEYFLDLQFQGDYGSMSPSGRAQGIGYAQELLARLANTTVPADQITTQNTTFLTPEYAPNDQTIYADFSHDDNLLSVLTALNYTQVVGDYLPADSKNDSRTFVLSQITPFAARIIWEVAECDENGNSTTIIRTILNDALVPMNEDQGCTPREDGACVLSEFVQYQQQTAYNASNFDLACFGINGTDYTITGPTVRNGTLGGSLAASPSAAPSSTSAAAAATSTSA